MCAETTGNHSATTVSGPLDDSGERSWEELGMLLASEWKWLVLGAPLLPAYSRFAGVS